MKHNLAFFYIFYILKFYLNVGPKIILVGIQKSGTTSFQDWFTSIGFKSAHWLISRGKLAELIYDAKKEGLPLLTFLKEYDAITEMNDHNPIKGKFSCYYPQIDDLNRLYEENPDSLFILNTRKISDQVRSMMNQVTGPKILRACQSYFKNTNQTNTNEEILSDFISTHNENVRKFFRQKPYAKFIDFCLDNHNITIFDQYFDSKGIPFPWSNANRKFERNK